MIKAKEVRIIGVDGEQVGILPTTQALDLAKNKNLDLLLISEQATPPVCKIVDFGQFRYQQQKKEKKLRKIPRLKLLKSLS